MPTQKKLSFTLMSRKTKSDRIKKQALIGTEEKFTVWKNYVVVTEKSNMLWMCIDSHEWNEAIKSV